MAGEEVDILTYAEMEEAKQFSGLLDTPSMSCAIDKLQDHLNQLHALKLNIAVTGESGSGKSSFVNAIRGLRDDDEKSAKTGVVETTMKPTPYSHPRHPNVIIWDLPGIGTENFNAEEYLEKVSFDKYNFFILIISDCFKSSSVDLAKAIEERNKKFYFLRTKIDENIRAEKRKRTFDQDKVLHEIRTDCLKGLKKCGVECPRVFLISSHELGKYDFSILVDTLAYALPRHRERDVLLYALPNICLQIHQRKREILQARVWRTALLFAAKATLPGLPLVDKNILLIEMTKYYEVFSLNDESLERLYDQTNVPVEESKACLKSPLNAEISAEAMGKRLDWDNVGNEFPLKVRPVLASLPAMAVGAEGGKVSTVLSVLPVLGSAPLAAQIFYKAKRVLQDCLEELADDAERVLCRAWVQQQTPV